MHRTIIAPLVLGFSFSASLARADVVCGDYLAGNYQPDEMTSPASQAIAEAARSCVCFDACASVCSVFVPEDGNGACGLSAPVYFVDNGGDLDACRACELARCSAEVLACYLDS